MITGRQIREGRALLRMSQSVLAGRAKVKLATLARAETVDGEPSITTAHANAIQSALEKAGVELIPENGDGVSVRLRKKDGS